MKKRFAVTFRRLNVDVKEAAAAIKCDPESLFDGCDFLEKSDVFEQNKALIFPDAGVCYANINEEDAARLAGSNEVLQIRELRPLGSTPLEKPNRIYSLDELKREFAMQPIPWNIQRVGADRCWPIATGAGVKVGIIDSEIDRDHPDLPIVEGVSFHPDAGTWYGTDDYHGTFCAGIVGARNNGVGIVGVAPDCDLYALRVNKNRSGNSDYIMAAMTWAARKKLDVVSISQWDTNGADTPDEEPWADMVRGAEMLNNVGCTVVGIAGNSGGFQNHWVSNPGRCPNFIAVGAIDENDDWWVSSSYGPDTLPEGMAVELVAPGVGIRSTVPDGQYLCCGSGTSYACPHVTGLVALVKQVHPDWSPEQIRTHLKSTAIDLGTAGRDEKYGIGLIDAHRAVIGPVS